MPLIEPGFQWIAPAASSGHAVAAPPIDSLTAPTPRRAIPCAEAHGKAVDIASQAPTMQPVHLATRRSPTRRQDKRRKFIASSRLVQTRHGQPPPSRMCSSWQPSLFFGLYRLFRRGPVAPCLPDLSISRVREAASEKMKRSGEFCRVHDAAGFLPDGNPARNSGQVVTLRTSRRRRQPTIAELR